MDAFESTLLYAEKVREKGDLAGALEVFNSLLNWGPGPAKYALLQCHIGQCQEHLGEVALAEEAYNAAMNFATKSGDNLLLARVQRHMLSIKLRQKHYPEALELGMSAWNWYKKTCKELDIDYPSDTVWIIHGIVKTLVDGGYVISAVRNWTSLEFHYLLYGLRTEPEAFRRNVWLTGWLADAACCWKPWSLLLYLVGAFIALVTGQGVRVKQFAKVRR